MENWETLEQTLEEAIESILGNWFPFKAKNKR